MKKAQQQITQMLRLGVRWYTINGALVLHKPEIVTSSDGGYSVRWVPIEIMPEGSPLIETFPTPSAQVARDTGYGGIGLS